MVVSPYFTNYDPALVNHDGGCGEALRAEAVSYKLSLGRVLQRKFRLESYGGLFRAGFRGGSGCTFW